MEVTEHGSLSPQIILSNRKIRKFPIRQKYAPSKFEGTYYNFTLSEATFNFRD